MVFLEAALSDAFCLIAALSYTRESELAWRLLRLAGPYLRYWTILLLALPFPVLVLDFLEELVAEILELLSFIPIPPLSFVPGEIQRLFKSTMWYICSRSGKILGFLIFMGIFMIAILGFEQIFIHTPRFGLLATSWIIKNSKPKTKLVPESSGIHNSNLTPYKYESFKSKRHIRLLILNPGRDIDEISCSLSCVCLDEDPKYDALSYVWGDPSDTRIILCSDGMVQITANLYTALWHLRYQDRQRIIWADALCINQKDLEERTQQVRMMSDIYSHANQALVWLGEEMEHVREAFGKVEHAASFFPSHETAHSYFDQMAHPENIIDDSILQDSICLKNQEEANILDFLEEPLVNLLRNPYFHRKWVIQEIANSRKAVLLYGDKQLDWEYMAGLIIHLWLRGFFEIMPSFALRDERTNPTSSIIKSAQNIICMDMIREGHPKDIFSLLYSTHQFQCSNLSDHVISILSLASDIDSEDLDLLADYTVTHGEIYKRIAIWSIEKMESLILLSFTSNSDVPSMNNLPSWIPNFSRLDAETMLPSHHQSAFAAAGASRINAYFSNNKTILHLNGKEIDSVCSLGENLLKTAPNPSNTSTNSDKEVTEPEYQALRFHSWLKECHDLVFGEEETISPQRLEAFCKTLTCDLTITHSRADPKAWNLVAQFIELVLNQGIPNGTLQPEAAVDFVKVSQSLTRFTARRRFCITSHGRLGLMPLNAKPGDIICVFYGGRVLYLIRPSDHGHYLLIGHCYVHGLMDGEAMEIDGIETQEFKLQ